MSKLLYVIGFFAFSVNVNANDQVKDIAKDVGYRSCLSTVSDIEDFFGNKVSYGSWSFWARENPDEQIFNSTLELTYGDGIQLVDFTVAPTKDGQCSFVYTRSLSDLAGKSSRIGTPTQLTDRIPACQVNFKR